VELNVGPDARPGATAGTDPRVEDLLRRFAQHPPVDDLERSAVARLREVLAGPSDPFSRATLPSHVTASAVVLDPVPGLVLLHLHRRIDRWLQPGGHVEPGERPEDAALRETLEETAVDARHPGGSPTIVHLDEHPGPDGHIHLDLRYLLLAEVSAARVGEGEPTGDGPGPTLRWVPLDEVGAHADDSLVRAITALSRRPDLHSDRRSPGLRG